MSPKTDPGTWRSVPPPSLPPTAQAPPVETAASPRWTRTHGWDPTTSAPRSTQAPAPAPPSQPQLQPWPWRPTPTWRGEICSTSSSWHREPSPSRKSRVGQGTGPEESSATNSGTYSIYYNLLFEIPFVGRIMYFHQKHQIHSLILQLRTRNFITLHQALLAPLDFYTTTWVKGLSFFFKLVFFQNAIKSLPYMLYMLYGKLR